ncbi:MAG: 3-oxoacyl-[acyl-carrier-protein] synthase, KASII [uncultured Thermomicrobiales bacterium]|uniref:3-oxoacyl-[acyl-carrier-protein] synthase 2 n=1 Tax=uncultured Thermomicrobiales bacterium TaxID=1645740 RepID=A0A6J4UZC3_9BACT|nr:MAG: 3-oxoacyl-[acyl-carrier-protein] synthase, KASII [uncultured Thermomicrobiales bacterium]
MTERNHDRETGRVTVPDDRRVVITGIGAITPIGDSAEGLWAGVRAGQSAVRTISRFDASPFPSHVAAEVAFDPLDHMTEKRSRRLDRFSQFAVVAAQQALADAGLTAEGISAEGAGIYVGSALGGIAFAEEQHEAYVRKGVHGVNPMLALSVFGGAAASNVTIELGLNGPSLSNGNSCASGMIAIGEAARLIRDGRVDVMLAGGAEAPLAPLTFGAFAMIRVISTRNGEPETASRPFDKGRDGFVIAEGAAVLALESLSHARARGARIYAELLGYGTSSDGHHMTAPRPDGAQAAHAMTLALADAGLAPDEIDYVNAHGSSTVLNDPTECQAIRLALGDQADRISVSGTKGLHGHALGATGAMETAICAMALQRGHLPGTANLVDRDPACDLDIVPPGGRDEQVTTLLNNAFGFGGINASLAMRAI